MLEVDLKRKRISLSMRRQDAPAKAIRHERAAPRAQPPKAQPPAAASTFGAALSAALARKR